MLLPPGLVLWHLVCQSRDCQAKPCHGNAENKGSLTFWYLVCQKLIRVLLVQDVSLWRRRVVAETKPTKAPAMADADIAIVRIAPETSFKNKAYTALREAIL